MSIKRTATINLVQGTKGVIGAVDILRTAITGKDAGDIGFAVDLLSSSADSYSGNTVNYSHFGFDELASPTNDLKDRIQVEEDLLASALVDLQVANTLIIAGRVAGESGESLPVEELDEARQNLEDVTNAVALPMGKAIAPVGQARFGFDELAKAPVMTASTSAKSAKDKFTIQSQALLDSLSVETKKILKEATSILEKLDSSKLAEGLNLVNIMVTALPKIGKLIAKGLELVRQGVEKITNLIGEKNMVWIKEKAKEVYDKVKGGGDLVDHFLADTYGKVNAGKYIEEKLKISSTSIEKIDEGTRQIAELQTHFAERMAIAVRIIKLENDLYKGLISVSAAIALVPGLGFSIPVTALPTATLVIMGSCLIMLGYAVLTGMDFADTSTVFVAVPGVIDVTNRTL